MPNKKEEITDMIADEAYDDPKFKKGLVLKFQTATIKLTKVDRKNKRTFGEHIILTDSKVVGTHDDHRLVHTGPGDLPYCEDCKVSINEPSTEDGEKKALDRKDRQDAEQN